MGRDGVAVADLEDALSARCADGRWCGMVGGMSSSFGRSIVLSMGGLLVVGGAVLMATEIAVGIGAPMIVWGLAAVSYRFTAVTGAEQRFATPSSKRAGQSKAVL